MKADTRELSGGKPFYGRGDPIAAIATPQGNSALAVIRTGGDGSIELLAKIFSRPRRLKEAPGNSIVHGWIISGGKKIDDVLVSVYRSPVSYTGEDGADISCHGGIAAVKAILSALKNAGFTDALPGEFTFRTFMNGKIDLTRAESVMEIVSAKTDKGREQAVRRLSGILQNKISAIKNGLAEILAACEINLDYPEDELSGGDNDPFPDIKNLEEIILQLNELVLLWNHERIFAEGALAVIAGRPNAGKSSLFNFLLREDRSIVTEIPGTTRDWIEAFISVDGIPLRLADTAGLREESGGIESIGIARSYELLEKADLILYLIDGQEGITPADTGFIEKNKAGSVPLLLIWNKADIAAFDAPPISRGNKFISISAKTGEGIPALLKAVSQTLEKSSGNIPGADSGSAEETGPGTLRQKELIEESVKFLEEALSLIDRGETLDLVSSPLRESVNCLGEITGEVTTADILEIMFSKFCVGK